MAAFGKAEASGVNPEEKSGVGDPKAVPCIVLNLVLASVLRRHWCQNVTVYCSFGSASDVERGGKVRGLHPVLHIYLPRHGLYHCPV